MATTEAVNLDSNSDLETFKALVDDAFRDAPLNLRLNKPVAILSETQNTSPGRSSKSSRTTSSRAWRSKPYIFYNKNLVCI